MFWHGAGVWHGFNFARPWAEQFRVIIPVHPGFGKSADYPGLSDMHDYVMHYLDLFDALGIDKMRLVGFSLGGCWRRSLPASTGIGSRGLSLSGRPVCTVRGTRRVTFSACRRRRFPRYW